MERDEVLRRVQNKKSNELDEMELDIFNKGCKSGVIFGLIGCLIMMVIKMIADVPWYDVYAIYCLMVCGQWLYKWIRLKKKSDFGYGILWGIIGIGFFVGYIMAIF